MTFSSRRGDRKPFAKSPPELAECETPGGVGTGGQVLSAGRTRRGVRNRASPGLRPSQRASGRTSHTSARAARLPPEIPAPPHTSSGALQVPTSTKAKAGRREQVQPQQERDGRSAGHGRVQRGPRIPSGGFRSCFCICCSPCPGCSCPSSLLGSFLLVPLVSAQMPPPLVTPAQVQAHLPAPRASTACRAHQSAAAIVPSAGPVQAGGARCSCPHRSSWNK